MYISMIFSKLSFQDGNEQDIIGKILDNNDLIEDCLGLFVTILSAHPKFLFDIKKYTIRVIIFNLIFNFIFLTQLSIICNL